MEKRGPKEIYNKDKIDTIFKSMCYLVKKGLTIEEACKQNKISKTIAYKKFTDKQKKELKELKLLRAKISGKFFGKFGNNLD